MNIVLDVSTWSPFAVTPLPYEVHGIDWPSTWDDVTEASFAIGCLASTRDEMQNCLLWRASIPAERIHFYLGDGAIRVY